MAEETKQAEQKAGGRNIFSVIFKTILGLAFLLLGVLALMRWWGLLVLLIKASIGPFLLLAGVITLAIAKE
jgi:hypothetical protein